MQLICKTFAAVFATPAQKHVSLELTCMALFLNLIHVFLSFSGLTNACNANGLILHGHCYFASMA